MEASSTTYYGKGIVWFIIPGRTHYFIPIVTVNPTVGKSSELVVNVSVYKQHIDYPQNFPNAYSLFAYADVTGNITYPNGTIQAVTYDSQNDGTYNYTFSSEIDGVYTFDVKAANSTMGYSLSRVKIKVTTTDSSGGGGTSRMIDYITLQPEIPVVPSPFTAAGFEYFLLRASWEELATLGIFLIAVSVIVIIIYRKKEKLKKQIMKYRNKSVIKEWG